MDSTAVRIGRALRDAREERGLSLRAAAQRSANRFKPTSIAGYERGERAVSVVRFCELADLYGVAPDRLLERALRSEPGARSLIVDLTDIEQLDGAEGQLVLAFVTELLRQRGEPGSGAIRIRTADLEILASASRRSPDELLEGIRAAVVAGAGGDEPPPTLAEEASPTPHEEASRDPSEGEAQTPLT